MKTPLLPLNAIVCPQGRIPLQIFEPRYLDMVSDCLKHDRGFVAVLLRDEGSRDSLSSSFYKTGTLVKMVDFGKSAQEGVINITVEGLSKVQVSDIERQDDGLWLATINKLSAEKYTDLPKEFDDLKVVLQALVEHPFVKDLNMDIDFHDSRQIAWRLTELLPLGNHQKQSLYEMPDSLSKLATISKQISEMVG